MKLSPLQKLGFLSLVTLCACGPMVEGQVVVYPTNVPAQAPEASQDEKALNYLTQVYPDARGRVTEHVTKTDGKAISFVSAVDGMQVESYTYTAFQRFLADNATMLLPDVLMLRLYIETK